MQNKTASPLTTPFFVLIMILFSGNSCYCSRSSELNAVPVDKPIMITGKIAVKGNEPRTWLCLTTDAGIEYRLKGELVSKIWDNYQQQIITLQGKRTSSVTKPGFPVGFDVLAINPPSH